jgi:hypothetical protein
MIASHYTLQLATRMLGSGLKTTFNQSELLGVSMEHTFSLASQARTHFDREAKSLLAALQLLPTRGQSVPARGSLASVPLVAHLTDADFDGPPKVTYVDSFGRLHGFEVHGVDIHEFLPQDAAQRSCIAGFWSRVDTRA